MGSAKAFLRGKFIAVYFYIKIVERFQINNLNFYLKKLETEKQTKCKARRRKEIIKSRVEKIRIEKTIEDINETKS